MSTSSRSFQLERLSRNTTRELGKTSKVLPSDTSKIAKPSEPLRMIWPGSMALPTLKAHGVLSRRTETCPVRLRRCAAGEVWAYAVSAHTASAATSFDNSFVEPLDICLPARPTTLHKAQSSIKRALQVPCRTSPVALNLNESGSFRRHLPPIR